MKGKIIFFAIALCCYNCNCQNLTLDSLRQAFSYSTSLVEKEKLLIQIVTLKSNFDDINYKLWLDKLCDLETENLQVSYECNNAKLKILFEKKKFEKAINQAKQLLETRYVLSHPKSNYHLNTFISDCFYNLRKSDSIIKYTYVSEPYISDNKEQAHFYNRLSELYLIQKNYEKATLYVDSLIVLSNLMDNNRIKADALYRLAKIQRKSRFNEEALKNYNQSLELDLQQDSISKSVGACYLEIGNVNFQMKKYTEALNNYKQSLRIYTILDRNRTIAVIHDELSSTYIRLKDYENAFKHINKAIEMKSFLGHTNDLAESYSRLGRLHYLKKDKDFKKSIEFLEKARKIDSINGKFEQLMYIELYLFNAYQLQKKTNAATTHINKYIKLKDSVNKSINRKMLAESEVKHQTLEKEKELSLQREKLAIQKIQKQKLWISLFIISSILLAILIIYLITRSKLLKQKIAIQEAVSEKKVLETKVSLISSQLQKKNDELNQQQSEERHITLLPNLYDFDTFLMEQFVLNEDELNLWKYIAEGYDQKKQADLLFRSANTIKTWKRLRLYPKLKDKAPIKGRYTQHTATKLFTDQIKRFYLDENKTSKEVI